MNNLFSVADYQKAARRRLPKIVYDYLEGGADDESGLVHNNQASELWSLLPKRLVDVSKRDQSIQLFNRPMTTPLIIAPTGLNSALWPQGDLALARAAQKAGIPFTLSTASNMSIEDVAQAGGDLWFQLYVVHRDLTRNLVQRARDAGYSTLILTVDVAVNGFRQRDLRNGFSMPFKASPRIVVDGITHPRWLWSYLKNTKPQLKNFAGLNASTLEAQAALLRRQMDASLSWNDLRRLRDQWPGTLLVKGILTAEDAAHCRQAGVDGVIVSNHGGRQLACLPAWSQVLAPVSDAFAGRGVLVDGGIRNGADAVKAIALGASAVMLGRATLYGLAARGEQGVTDVIEFFKRDIDRTLALIGCPSLCELDRSYIARRPF